MAERINFDSGLKTYEINFTDRNEVVEIQFNPTDKNLPVRLKKAQEILDERLKEFENKTIDLKPDGTLDYLSYIEDFERITNIVHEEIDRAFNNTISNVVFKYCNPLSIVNGNYYFMSFFDAITPLIEKLNISENKKANEKVEKYLKKYNENIKK